MSPEDERDERISSILDEMVGDAMLNTVNLMRALWPEEVAFTGAHLKLAQTMLISTDVRVRDSIKELFTITLESDAISAYEEEMKLAQEEDVERKADNAHYAKSQAFFERGRNR